MIGDRCLTDLPEEEVETLFKLGQVDRKTQCRVTGRRDWQNVDECLPLLKYIHRTASQTVPAVAPIIPASVAVLPVEPALDEPFPTEERGKPPLTSSLKAGWICFALGVAIAWIFPPAFLFYSVALIMAIVAMCTHQVSRGLILLLSSFVAMGTSAFLSMILAVGLFAAAMKPAIEEAQKTNQQLQQSQRNMQTQVQQPQSAGTGTLRQVPTPPQLPSFPSAQAADPVVGYPPVSLSKRDLVDEISRLETRQRQLRRIGRDLDRLTYDYLTKLRAELDSRRER